MLVYYRTIRIHGRQWQDKKPETKPKRNAAEKPERKAMDTSECLRGKRLELDSSWSSPEGFLGEDMVEKSLCIV